MAYAHNDLVVKYTALNLGKAPDAATALALDAWETQTQNGTLTDAVALANTLKLVGGTTAVAVEAYQFFTGHAPSNAGLTYLVNSATNTADLNDAYYAKFAQENRFINFAINLGTGAGEGAAAFAAAYATVDYATVVATAYDKIIGNAAATAAGKDVAAAVTYLSRADNITYLTAFVKASTGYTSDADVSLAVKAALIGEILNAATVSGIGGYATATNKLLVDLSDGTLATDNAAGINLFTAYPANPPVGTTFALTAGIDTVTGGAAADTINAVNTATTAVFGALDVVDGGDGVDTFNIADTATASGVDFTLPGGLVVKNVENLNVTTNGTLNMDVSGYAGLTTAALTSADAAAGTQTIVADAGTNLKVVTASGNVDITGGNAVTVAAIGGNVSVDSALSVVSKTNGGGTTDIFGTKLTSVTATGDGVVNIGNDTTSTTGTKATLTSVTLTSVDAAANLYGKGITNVTVGGTTTAARTVTVNNATAAHALTLTAQGTNNAAGTTAFVTTLTDAAATSLSVNATAKASVALTGSTALASVTSTGVGALSLDLASIAAIKSFNSSGATGNQTLTNINAATTSITTGSGNDTFTLTATAKATVDTGAGNDTVTLGSTLAASSSVLLGAGNDKLLGAAAVAIDTTLVIDGGDGSDTLAAALVNAGNAAQFKNFEVLGLTNGATLDTSLITGLTSLELVAGGGGAYSSVGLSQLLSVTGTAAGATSLSFAGATGSADAYSITFAGTGGATLGAAVTIAAGAVTVNSVEALTVNSGSASGFTTNTIALTDAAAKTVTITGSQALTATFGTLGTSGATTGVSLIDASAATGVVNITTTGVIGASANTALSVKTGSGADLITLHALAAGGVTTVDAGAGIDTITTNTTASILTGGTGVDIFDVKATLVGAGVSATPIVTTITDLAVGETVQLATAAGVTDFVTTAINVGTATTLAQALDLATDTSVAATNSHVVWFNYGGNTYIVQDNAGANVDLAAGDLVVKLTGVLDLSHSAVSAGELFTFG